MISHSHPKAKLIFCNFQNHPLEQKRSLRTSPKIPQARKDKRKLKTIQMTKRKDARN